mmetsp:Transcript_27924/g.58499  ORF Transcript_27924/g.58499 Transcript_27924/m.58499 type:complete len:233 (+) Transcript_27924:606-1304(+)
MQGLRKGFKEGNISQSGNGPALVKVDERLPLVGNVLGCESKVLVDSISVGRQTKDVVHADLGVRESVPSMGCGGFDRKRGDVSGQDTGLVFLGLLQKDVLARHADQGDIDSFRRQEREGLDREREFSSSGNNDEVGGSLGGNCDVGSLGGLFGGGYIDAHDGGTGAGNNTRCSLVGHGGDVGGVHFVGIRRTPEVNVGHGTDLFKGLDRLMGGSIAAHVDRVVCKDVDHTEF